jgi:hypothetical protein
MTVAFAIVCCPCFACAVACLGRCGTAGARERQRRAARRNTRLHPSLIVAPAPPPAYVTVPGAEGDEKFDAVIAHLRRDGNRVFHLRPDDRMLESGNVGALYEGFELSRPQLVATLPKGKWKEWLRMLMEVRGETLAGDNKWWRTMESIWVEKCVEKLKSWKREDEKGSPEDGGWFEVWSVMVQTPHLTAVVSDKDFHSNTAVELVGLSLFSVAGGAWPVLTRFVQIGTNYLWAKAIMSPSIFLRDQMPVDDFFEGRWNEEYVNGDAEALRNDDIANWFRTIVHGPRRSQDSGTREVVEDEDE